MHDFGTANLALIKERFPEIHDLIVQTELPDSRRVLIGPKSSKVYQIFDNGRWKNLTSAYAPHKEAERQIAHIEQLDVKVIFMLGEAGFYHLEELLAEIGQETKVIVFSVQPGVIRQIVESRDLQSLLSDERFFLVLRQGFNDIKNDISAIFSADLYSIPSFEVFLHPVEEKFQTEFFYEFQKCLHWVGTTTLLTKNTTQVFEHWWIHNFTCNVPYILKGIPFFRLKNSWVGKPVIVIGAGPSLNKNIEYLRQAKGKAMLFCVDTAYRILVKYNIEPDLLVTLDGSELNAEHMKEQDYSEIPLFMDLYSHRDIVQNHGKHTAKILLTGRSYHSGWWERTLCSKEDSETFASGGSVATAAFSLARYIGADPVILVGVDLSYPGGACYADGVLHAQKTTADVRRTRQMYPVKDIYGQTVETTHDYRYYLNWLHKEAQKKDRHYVNATEGGAVREGFEILTLTETLDRYCPNDFEVNEWKNALKLREVPLEKQKTVLENLKRTRWEMRAARRYLERMVLVMEKYIAKSENKDYIGLTELSAKLTQILEHFNRLEFAKLFLDAHSHSAVYTDIKITESIKKNKEQHPETERALLTARQSYNLFLSLKQLSIDSIPMLDEGIESMKKVFNLEGVQTNECS